MPKTAYKKAMFIALLVSSVILYCVLMSNPFDSDMFFEIASGNDLLQGNFSTASHLGNFPIIVQQWLYAVTLAIADKFGLIGHIVWVVIQHIILCTLSSIFIYRKTKNKKLAIIGSFFTILLCHNYMINIRPQIITMILLVAELLLVELYKEKKKLKYLIAIFPILILAANFHQAVFLYHLMVLVPYFVDKRFIDYSLLQDYDRPAKDISYRFDWKLALCSVGYLACSLCTPYGVNGALYIVRTAQSNAFKQMPVQEIGSLNLISYIGLKLLVLVGLTIYLLYKHKIDKFTTYFVFLVTVLSFINVRHISIAFIPVMYMLAKVDISKAKHAYVYGYLAICCIVLSVVKVRAPMIMQSYGDIATVIENHDAKIYNTANVGGWLEYNGYTNVKYDVRPELFTKELSGVDNYLYDYQIFMTGYYGGFIKDEEILKQADKYDYMITYKTDYVNRVLDWEIIYQNDDYIVWQNDNDFTN